MAENYNPWSNTASIGNVHRTKRYAEDTPTIEERYQQLNTKTSTTKEYHCIDPAIPSKWPPLAVTLTSQRPKVTLVGITSTRAAPAPIASSHPKCTSEF